MKFLPMSARIPSQISRQTLSLTRSAVRCPWPLPLVPWHRRTPAAMQSLKFMFPVLISRPGPAAAVASHLVSPPIYLRVIRAVVSIFATDALEQQLSHQIARFTFNQSVLFVTVDVRRVFDVDDVSTSRVSSRPVCNISSSRSSLVLGLVLLFMSVLVHASILSLVLNRLSISIANFFILGVALKLLTVNAHGSLSNMNSHPMDSMCRLMLSWSSAFVNKLVLLSLPLTL